jgi:radical SAM superfamily enzyme
MPLEHKNDLGTNEDGSLNQEYCHYCYQNGQFTDPEMTMEEMIELTVRIMEEKRMPSDLIEQTKEYIPMLKRWRR